ncbi:MAG: DUF924 family protein [Sulfurifustaceae bacterium]
MNPDEVLRFWFEDIVPDQWWRADSAFDATIRARFEPVPGAAGRGALAGWRATAEGRLAEILVLDQFSRNLYRGAPAAFAHDVVALVLAQEAVACGADRRLPPAKRAFLYLPYMHSESLLVHADAMRLFDQPGLESNLEYEIKHREILERFGRYPHRNAILGRPSTPAEIEFLRTSDSSF